MKKPASLILLLTFLFTQSCSHYNKMGKTKQTVVWQPSHQTDTGKDFSEAATCNAIVEAAMETNTIITTPENMMIVTHKVSDFEKWKASYDEHDSMRLVHGIHSYVIGRGVEDANMVFVAVKADDMAKAKAFAKDPSLKKRNQINLL